MTPHLRNVLLPDAPAGAGDHPYARLWRGRHLLLRAHRCDQTAAVTVSGEVSCSKTVLVSKGCEAASFAGENVLQTVSRACIGTGRVIQEDDCRAT